MKPREISINAKPGHTFFSLIKDFFNRDKLWGRLNISQAVTGLTCTTSYLSINLLFPETDFGFKSFTNSSGGLIAALITVMLIMLFRSFTLSRQVNLLSYPWYEKYMPLIITLLGLITLIGLQNFNNGGANDAGLWIYAVITLVVFIIAAGYFVEGSTNEEIIKIWFALLGYFLSVVAFFYLLEQLF